MELICIIQGIHKCSALVIEVGAGSCNGFMTTETENGTHFDILEGEGWRGCLCHFFWFFWKIITLT